jgi:hypothetical protein
MVACFCLKPNWWSAINRFSCKIGWILVSKSFSSNFERIGSKLIGLQDVTSAAGFPGFRIAIIWETLHVPGSTRFSKHC